MSKGSKIITGLLSIIPLVLVAVAIVQVFNLFPQFIDWDNHEPDAYTVFAALRPMFITAILAGLLSIGLLIFFIIHMLNNKQIEGVEKVVWILVFLFAGAFGYPIYWYMRIWHEKI